ncbi:hypothetical protein ABEB36_008468 [Hypothenemus hampei]|uniref:lysozyme n=1 Tax=Hypothenemus hampei TaxID=57062 RepID=A0ABD1EM00_HYPHA
MDMRKVQMTFFATIVLTLLLAYDVEPLVFTKCGLTRYLLNNGFDRSLIGNWICLVESESSKNTSRITEKADRSKSLGLFQINDKLWCKWKTPGGRCEMKCETFIDDDIQDDSMCAKKVQKEMGFRYWEGWMRSCYRRHLPIPPC